MKRSEGLLLTILLVLAALFAGVIGFQTLKGWQRRIERRERELELSQMEAQALLARAGEWRARGEWLSQSLPAAASELDANQGMLDALTQTAAAAGLKITSTQIETEAETAYYTQYGVVLGLGGTLPDLMRWIHGVLDPTSFYVVPSLKVTVDKDDAKKVSAQARIWKWYAPGQPITSSGVPAGAATERPTQ